MKVAVLGSGVIGVTAAWYLVKAGHEVVVIDRQPGPARETSFANAGEISPGYASPWAAPGIPLKALRWLTMAHAPLILRPKFDYNMLTWLIAMIRNCTKPRYAVNKARMMRLAEYSLGELIALREETGLSYDGETRGTLQLFRTLRQIEASSKDIAVLQDCGIPFEVLDREGCIAAEPGLAHAHSSFVGGLRLPGDETGDCFKFSCALAALGSDLGVKFQFNTNIHSLLTDGHKISGVMTDEGKVVADSYVVALGSYSPGLLKRIGIDLPIYPVKGYSITLPVLDGARAPASTLMDETYKVAITRLGNRIRVGGMAEIAGFDDTLHEGRRLTLLQSLVSLFPGAGDSANVTFWSGLRPMTPDGTPIIGRTILGNLFLNCGHGTLGWTMACGSGALLADLISGREPTIDSSDLSISRYDRLH